MPKGSSTTLVITLVLGAAAGFALGYAVFGASGIVFPKPEWPTAAGPDVDPMTEPPVDVATPPQDNGPAEPMPELASAPETGAELDPEPTPEPVPGQRMLEDMEDAWAARHLFIGIEGQALTDAEKALLQELKPGGVVLSAKNTRDADQTAALIRDIKSAVGLGGTLADLPLVAIDHEGNTVSGLGLESAPGTAEIAAKRDVAYARDTGKQYGAASHQRGFAVMLAPVLDISEPGAPEALQSSTFGSDRLTVSALGMAFAVGVMDAGVLPVVKRFPGHGGASGDSTEGLPVITKDAAELAEVVFPFSHAASIDTPGIMVGHVAVPALEDDHQNRPATLSPRMVTNLIREMWAYEGVIIADDLSLAAITADHEIEQAAVDALAAGCDALVLTSVDPERIASVCRAIESAVSEERLSKSALRKSKRRLEEWQTWLRNPAPLKGPFVKLPELPAEPEVAETTNADTPAEDTEQPPADMQDTEAEPATAVAEDADTEEPSAPPETSDDTQASEPAFHVVGTGDHLSKIANQYGVTMKAIMEHNNLDNPDHVWIGQKLKIPARP